MAHFPLFVQNEPREAVDGAIIDIEDPATGASIATCATAGPADVAAAVEAAIGPAAEAVQRALETKLASLHSTLLRPLPAARGYPASARSLIRSGSHLLVKRRVREL